MSIWSPASFVAIYAEIVPPSVFRVSILLTTVYLFLRCRVALKRPREEMSKQERALESVVRYLDKFGDQFMRPAQRTALAAAREKEKVMSVWSDHQKFDGPGPTSSAVLDPHCHAKVGVAW